MRENGRARLPDRIASVPFGRARKTELGVGAAPRRPRAHTGRRLDSAPVAIWRKVAAKALHPVASRPSAQRKPPRAGKRRRQHNRVKARQPVFCVAASQAESLVVRERGACGTQRASGPNRRGACQSVLSCDSGLFNSAGRAPVDPRESRATEDYGAAEKLLSVRTEERRRRARGPGGRLRYRAQVDINVGGVSASAPARAWSGHATLRGLAARRRRSCPRDRPMSQRRLQGTGRIDRDSRA